MYPLPRIIPIKFLLFFPRQDASFSSFILTKFLTAFHHTILSLCSDHLSMWLNRSPGTWGMWLNCSALSMALTAVWLLPLLICHMILRFESYLFYLIIPPEHVTQSLSKQLPCYCWGEFSHRVSTLATTGIRSMTITWPILDTFTLP